MRTHRHHRVSAGRCTGRCPDANDDGRFQELVAIVARPASKFALRALVRKQWAALVRAYPIRECIAGTQIPNSPACTEAIAPRRRRASLPSIQLGMLPLVF